MRSRPLLLLLASSPAAAYDLDSLRADSSFGLFRDEYDYLREPAALAGQPGRHVFTVLGNQGGGDRFSLGYLGQAGPGVLGVIGDISSSAADGSSSSTVAPTAASGGTVTAVTSASRVRKGGIFLGYGLPLSERLAAGAGAEVTDERWRTSLTPVPGGSPVVGGSLTTVTEGGAEISREEGRYTAQESRARALLGLERAGPKLDLEVDLFAERLRTQAQARASATTTTTSYTLAGYAPDAPLDENLTATLPGLAVDGAVALGLRFDAADAFSLDAVASGVGLPDQRTALDLGSLLVSGVFHLP